MQKADDHIARKFVKQGNATLATLAWVADDETAVPISDEEADILRGLDRYYADV